MNENNIVKIVSFSYDTAVFSLYLYLGPTLFQLHSLLLERLLFCLHLHQVLTTDLCFGACHYNVGFLHFFYFFFHFTVTV